MADSVLQRLRLQSAAISLAGFTALAAAQPFFRVVLPRGRVSDWLLAAVLVWAYFSIILFRNLSQNRASADGSLRLNLGPANTLTLARAVAMAAFAGLLAVPRPAGAYAWLPGVLYTAAALPDFVDGIIARKTDSASRLGELLDMNVDSVGVLAATTLAAVYGIVPWWYLPIGLARYLFVAGVWVRTRLGQPVYDLPPSVRRRGFAALKMGFLFVVLFPIFRPPGTHIAAAAFGIPFALGFLWDWGLTTGRIRPGTWGPETPFVRALVNDLPVLLRAAYFWLALPALAAHLADPALRWLGAAELVAAVLLALGAAAHSTAIGAAILIGINQHLAPLAGAQLWLVPVVVGLIFLGSGRFSLWPVEDRLIFHRIGDQAPGEHRLHDRATPGVPGARK